MCYRCYQCYHCYRCCHLKWKKIKKSFLYFDRFLPVAPVAQVIKKERPGQETVGGTESGSHLEWQLRSAALPGGVPRSISSTMFVPTVLGK